MESDGRTHSRTDNAGCQVAIATENHERIFHMLVGGGVNQHMENSICFVVFIFESFPKVHIKVIKVDVKLVQL